MPLLVFEFFGTTEMLLIALVALIIFGPRKLPELGRSLGKSIGEFKRASEDFKSTWEREVEVERIERELHIEREVDAAMSSLPDGADATADAAGRDSPSNVAREDGCLTGGQAAEEEQTTANTIARSAPRESTPRTVVPDTPNAPVGPAGKTEWL